MRRRPAALGLAAALIAALGLATASVAGASPTFGPAVATSTFGVGITVEQSATLPADVRRVEALVRTTGSDRTLVVQIATPGAGATTLRYEFETALGSLWPNTQVELGFRVTSADGTVVEGPTTTVRYDDDRFQWRTLEGDLVRVHWAEGGDAFGRRVLAIGEEAVERATALLGVDEGNPIDFFVYADDRAFQEVLGPGSRENIGGVAPGGLRTLFASIGSTNVGDPWVGIVVPHELTHVVFETATANPYHDAPHWLNEGLATYLAEGYSPGRRGAVERAVADDSIMPLQALVGAFPTTGERFSLGYGESVAAVDYMIRTYGQDALVRLIRSYAEGVTDDAAFEAALGVDVAGFEAGWFADLGIEPPQPFGPQPAPTGPVPPGWQGAAPSPGASGAPSTPGPTPGTDEPGVGSLVAPVLGIVIVLLGAGIVLAARARRRAPPGAGV
ncbi:MAG TPA: peptidase MA family metallohydrolase [Candidatus Deferrimicrobiaceae bacterium]|nr:peptidase MA family metallohydrolase [Candidatus Deferrimicrobiaceae bacterium]